jgi:hypothetical protein
MVTTDIAFDPRRVIELEAANPRSGDLYAHLLDRTIHLLAGRGAAPSDALFVAGQVVRGTPWASFRSGRSRLATASATYLTWLAPPSPWTYVGGQTVSERRPVSWQSPDGAVVIDVLLAVKRDDKTMAGRISRDAGDEVVAVRALDLHAPNHSTVYEADGSVMPLTESKWAFGPEVQR